MVDLRRLIPVLALIALAPAARAQRADSACSYARCSLNIIPRLTALDVVRGDREERVASLAFLAPRGVAAAFEGSDVAQQHATRAIELRRVGAMLTDLGGAVAIVGIVGSVMGHSRPATAAGIAGALLVGVSVPIHFSADAELSRAVREYNRRFTR